MEIAQETYNLFQFISFCHHLLLVAPLLLLLLPLSIALPSLLWPRPQLMLMLPTFDFGMSRRSRFAIVRVHVPCPCRPVARFACPCRPCSFPLSLPLSLTLSLALQVRLFHVCLGCHLAVVVLGIIWTAPKKEGNNNSNKNNNNSENNKNNSWAKKKRRIEPADKHKLPSYQPDDDSESTWLGK